MSRRRLISRCRLTLRRRAAAVAGCLAVIGAVMVPGPAWAAPTTEVVQGEIIRLVSVADWAAASSLLPGEPVQWDVAVSANPPDPGTVTVAVSATGDAPLVLDVAVCRTAWQVSGCPGGATDVRSGWSIPRDGAEIDIAEFPDSEVAHVRLAIALGAGAGTGAGASAGSTDVRLHAHGVGEAAVIGPDGGLAVTGLPPVAPWIGGGGALLVALGAVLIAWHGRRRSRAFDEGGAG